MFYTHCPKSLDPVYIVTYYIKWVTTSWTDGMLSSHTEINFEEKYMM